MSHYKDCKNNAIATSILAVVMIIIHLVGFLGDYSIPLLVIVALMLIDAFLNLRKFHVKQKS